MRKRSWIKGLLGGKRDRPPVDHRPGQDLFLEPRVRRLEDRRVLAVGAVDAGAMASGIVEGTVAALSGATFTDTTVDGKQPHTAEVDWGDSTVSQGTVTEPTSTDPGVVDGSHAYLDDGSYTVKVTITGADLTSLDDTTTFQIQNDPPNNVTLQASPTPLDENGQITLNGSFADGGILDSHTITIDWGDGSAPENFAIPLGDRNFSATHQYLDDNPTGSSPDPYQITVSVADDDGDSGVGATSVMVANVAPSNLTIDLAPAASPENGTVSLTGSFNDPGTLDEHTVSIDWGDGSAPEVLTLAVGDRSFSATHDYLDDGPKGSATHLYTATVSVVDDDGGSANATDDVTVNNVAPSNLTLSLSPSAVDEPGFVSLQGSFDDPGTLDTHTVQVDWGDGHTETIHLAAGVTTFDTNHTYDDDTPSGTPSDAYDVSVTVIDDDGESTAKSASIQVNNISPSNVTLVLSATTVDENGTITLDGSFLEPGLLDTQTVEINWGDGSANTVLVLAAGETTFQASHNYADDAPTGTGFDSHTIAVSVTDDDTGVATASTTIDVYNVPPGMLSIILDDPSIDENGGVTLTGSFDDPGNLDVHTLSIDWGDGSPMETVVLPVGDRTFSLSHTYLEDAPTGTSADSYTIGVTLSDDDGGQTSASTSVDVANVAPQIVNLVLDDPIVDENGTTTLNGTFVDPGMLDEYELEIDWGDGSPPATVLLTNGERTFSISHQYDDDNPSGTSTDDYTIGVTLTDDDGGVATDSTVATVNNVAPVVQILAITPVAEGGTATLTGTYSDVGPLDTHTIDIDWDGDGNYDELGLTVSGGNFSFTHVYADDTPTATPSDTFDVFVRLHDDDGGIDSEAVSQTVANEAPTLSQLSAAAIDEDGVATLSGTIVDASALDSLTLVIDWGDPTSPNNVETYSLPAGTTSFSLTHQYLDDNPAGTANDAYTIGLTLTDDDTGQAVDSVAVSVSNVAPQLVNVVGSTIDENSVATVSAMIDDPGSQDVFTVTVDWQDGSLAETITGLGLTDSSGTIGSTAFVWDADSRFLTLSHQYLDDGAYPGNSTADDSYSVALTVTDDDTGSSSTTATVVVENITPTLIDLTGSTIDENGIATVTATINDVGTKDEFSATVEWQDGTPAETITGLGLTDSSGTVGSTSYTWDASTRLLTLTHQYLDDGTYPGNGTGSDGYAVSLSVADDDLGVVFATADVHVSNVNPQLINVTDSTIDENGVATVTATIDDPGTKDVFDVTVNWQDGTPADTITGLGLVDSSGITGGTSYTWVAATRQLTLSHQYLDDGTYPGNGTSTDTFAVSLQVTDDDLGMVNATADVVVNNVVPQLVNVTGSAIDENGVATVTSTIDDAGTKDVFGVTVNWQDGTPADTITGLGLTDSSGTVGGTTFVWVAATRSLTLTHQYLDDGTYPGNGTSADTYIVSLQVFDDDLGVGNATADVQVHNVHPQLINISGSTIDENGIATVTAQIDDPGTQDVFDVTVDWQDGTSAETITGLGPTDTNGTVGSTTYTWVAATRTLSLTHQYLDDGAYPGNGMASDTYSVSLIVDDDDLGTDNAATDVVVNNVAPNLINVTGSTIDENGVATVTATIDDPGSKDVFDVTVNWQDGTPADTITGLGLTDSSGTTGSTGYTWDAAARLLTLMHQYIDDGTFPGSGTPSDTYNVSLAVADDDLGTGNATAVVVTNNVPPELINVTGSMIDENDVATVTARIDDPGTQDVFEVTVNWQDGTSAETITGLGLADSSGSVGSTSYTWVAATRTLTLTHQYLDDGTYPGNDTATDTYTVSLLVADDDLGTGSATADVIVSNVAPELIDVSGSTIAENGVATVTATIDDPGTKDVFNVTVNWQDGTPADTIVGLGLSDSSGTVGGTTYVWVAASRTLTLTHQYLDDGVYPGNGTASDTYSIALAIADDDLGTGNAATDVVVNNVAPNLINVSGSTLDENGVATVTATIDDPGSKDVFDVTVNWQDGMPADTITGLGLTDSSGTVGGTSYLWTAATRSLTLTHQYLDDGNYPGNGTSTDSYAVSLLVADDDLGTGNTTVDVVVNNISPNLIDVSGTTIDENGVATVTATVDDPGTKDVFDVTVNWQDGTPADTITGLGLTDSSGTVGSTSYTWDADARLLTLTHQYLDDGTYPGNGTAGDNYSVSLAVSDDDLGTGSATAPVVVNNVSPNLINVTGSTIDENGVATVTATIDDPGTKDVFDVTVNWQDGTPADTITGLELTDSLGTVGGTTYVWTAASRTLTLTHQYLDDGTYPGNGTSSDNYSVSLAVSDDDLGTGSATATVVVNNVSPNLINVTGSTIDENGVATVTATIDDPGTKDVFDVTVNWQDGTPADTITGLGLTDSSGTIGSTNYAWIAATRSLTLTHQYLDDGTYPGNGTASDNYSVSLAVYDDDLGTGSATATVVVTNVSPNLINVTGSTIDENGVATITSTIDDPGTKDVFDVTVNWQDGTPADTITGLGLTDSSGTVDGTSYTWDADSRLLTLTHQYLDDGTYPGNGTASDTYTVDLAVNDDDLGTGGATATVVVNNVSPSLINVTGSTIDENGVATVTSTIDDPGSKDVFDVTVNWQDGTPADTITVLGLTDSSGTVGSTSYTWDADTRLLTLSHQYLDDGTYPGNGTATDTYTVDLAVNDDDLGAGSTTNTVIVNNVDPDFVNIVGTSIDEDSVATISATISDPGTQDVFDITVDWQDGTPTDTITGLGLTDSSGTVGGTTYVWTAATRSLTLSHKYLDDGTYPGNGTSSDTYNVQLQIADDDLGQGDRTAEVVVNNVIPANIVFTATPDNLNEVTSVTITGTFSDTGRQDQHTLMVDWGDGTPPEAITIFTSSNGSGTFTATHTYLDDNPSGSPIDVNNIRVFVTDDDGGTGVGSTPINVNDIAPVINTLTASQLDITGTTTLNLTFSDTGVQDTFTILIDWGDGLPPQTVTLPAGSTALQIDHQYLAPPDPANPANDIPINVTVLDDDQLSAAQLVLADVPGKHVFGVAIDLSPRSEPIQFQVVANVASTPINVPPPLSNVRNFVDRRGGFDIVVGADRRVIVRTVSIEGEEGNEAVLPEKTLDDLSSMFRRLPDGRYRIYLRQDKIERLILDVNVRQGKPVDPNDENDGTQDRPPTSQLEPDQPSDPAGQAEVSTSDEASEVVVDQPIAPEDIDWSKPARLLRDLRRRLSSC